MHTDWLSDIRTTFSLDEFASSGLYQVTGEGDLPTWFDVSSLASECLGAAGCSLARYVCTDDRNMPNVEVDRRLASFWTASSMRPVGWKPQPTWDAIAGDYATKDGWIRLHTNHHRKQALDVLGCDETRDDVAKAVSGWKKDDLEMAIIDAGGCAAAMRSMDDWQHHPQGTAVRQEPLVFWDLWETIRPNLKAPDPVQPFANIKILDLTRVIAGPTAGRFLSAFGANVLRIDPPFWEEPGVAAEMTLGKRCAGLDLTSKDDREIFQALLQEADVLLHGYRPGALSGLGFDPAALRQVNPALIDVSLCAYGWTGPWSTRRGFDTLVQMSSGITDHSMTKANKPVPPFLPVAILDYATGFLMAAATIAALDKRRREGSVMSAKLSLARTAQVLLGSKRNSVDMTNRFAPETEDDLDPWVEESDWGPSRRLRFPLTVQGVEPVWRYPASNLRSSPPNWSQFFQTA